MPLVVAACSAVAPPETPPTRLYDGAARPAAEVAVIKGSDHDYFVGGWRADIEAIDGTEVHPIRVEVLPGQHTVRMGGKICLAGVCSGTVPAELTFTAIAGHSYQVDCDYWLSEMVVRDNTNDRIIARVICEDGMCTPTE